MNNVYQPTNAKFSMVELLAAALRQKKTNRSILQPYLRTSVEVSRETIRF